MRWLQRLWARITEPRRMKVFYFFVYLLTAGVGLVTLLSPPRSIAWELGPGVTVILAWFLIAGGVSGVLTVLTPWWWAERLLGIGPILIGLSIQVVMVAILHVQSAPEIGSQLQRIGIVVLASAVFTARLLAIFDYSYDPRCVRQAVKVGDD